MEDKYVTKMERTKTIHNLDKYLTIGQKWIVTIRENNTDDRLLISVV